MHDKERKSNASAEPFDVVLMFKVRVLQQLHNLSNDRVEYPIRDWLSFMRFLGLQLEDRVPDSKAGGSFRERFKYLDWCRSCLAAFTRSGPNKATQPAPNR